MAIMEELHQEHRNLQRLLEILDRKVEKFRAGVRPDFQLMSDVVDYVGGYADIHHHPREDRMFEHFAGRNAEVDRLMKQCAEQHARLHQQSIRLHDSIEGVLHDAAVLPLEELVDQLELFVKQQAAHLDLEEEQLFPAMAGIASEEDWRQIDAQLPAPSDPLFGQKQSEEYKALYRALLEDSPG